MAGGLFTLLLLSIIMAIASFAAGMLPLAVSLTPSQLRLISTVGMGVLVGTSMIVIIPEGIETIYSANPTASVKPIPGIVRARSTWDPNPAARDMPTLFSRQEKEEGLDHTHTSASPIRATDAEEGHGDDHEETDAGAHKWVGLSLISGFILMYLIDVIPTHTHTATHVPYHIALDSLRSLNSPPDTPAHGPGFKPSSTTLGLVIHAAADGIALGASSTSSNVALEAIIFLAIMLHKAPAAFGLSAVLLRAGLGKRQARTHLIVFSMAAPVGAIVTWILVNLLGGEEVGGAGMQWWTGVLLLFSGGTFLYVAMHTMQEQAAQADKPGLRDTCAAVFGMLLPLLTQVGHHHH
ncbi:hypothetical protein Q9L58_003958 [Maublancomyces gigas]|uniref:Solute carrier family 39 member 9 n=1 Tax=Discina gigas TaxID=1032678 RepID=A0ABR3GMV4_9PEZI